MEFNHSDSNYKYIQVAAIARRPLHLNFRLYLMNVYSWKHVIILRE